MENKIYLEHVIDFSKLEKPILFRHQGTFLSALIKEKLIEEYQSYQGKSGFLKAKTIISFVAEERNMATFYGV